MGRSGTGCECSITLNASPDIIAGIELVPNKINNDVSIISLIECSYVTIVGENGIEK
jgi:hypothetical protein